MEPPLCYNLFYQSPRLAVLTHVCPKTLATASVAQISRLSGNSAPEGRPAEIYLMVDKVNTARWLNSATKPLSLAKGGRHGGAFTSLNRAAVECLSTKRKQLRQEKARETRNTDEK